MTFIIVVDSRSMNGFLVYRSYVYKILQDFGGSCSFRSYEWENFRQFYKTYKSDDSSQVYTLKYLCTHNNY